VLEWSVGTSIASDFSSSVVESERVRRDAIDDDDGWVKDDDD